MKVIADMDYSETVYLTPAEYKIAMMKDNSNAVLSRSDALCLRGYGNWDYEETIQVYSTKQLEKPFECDVVDSFDNIEYTIEHGILVCTERQAFIDLLKDPKNEIQTLLEALGDYYFTHENSFDSLRLSAEQRSLLSKYENDAIHYWNY
jgi:hypothetical protein